MGRKLSGRLIEAALTPRTTLGLATESDRVRGEAGRGLGELHLCGRLVERLIGRRRYAGLLE